MHLPLLTDFEKAHLSERQPLPERYRGLTDEQMDQRLIAARAALGRRAVILGHHYQRDEVIKFADFTGDSYTLARQIASRPDAEFIIFCGVHFMAESADVLRAPHQQVILPDLAAGCSMADMVEPDQMEVCWNELAQMGIGDVLPITYINSAAAVKAFCGERGGLVCTSSNAAAAMQWAWARAGKILFVPDQHLGRNVAYRLGVPLEEMVVWDPNEIWGGLEPEQVRRARIILWKGHCSVHTRFTARQIAQLRDQHPGLRVVVHPEVPWEVAQAADACGSTEFIIRQVTESPVGSVWAVGTEIHLVQRLARELAPDRTVLSLDQFGCLCSTMFRVSPNHLLWVLEGLLDGDVHNRIVVPDDQKRWTRVALDRMLAVR
ncbi:MAG TPA: quinolinate synthase NadA [Vicinamibacterales bacterium]|nr:quinolinate synthase NadA [Vicinamibacterales bacterium]